MGRSSITRILLLCLLLLVFSNNGFGRKLSIREDHSINVAASELQAKSREMIELDYEGAGPNKNGRSVYLPPQPSPSPPPPPPPPPESGY